MNEPMTLREIGLELGISHQYVAEILDNALRKIRNKLKERGVELEDLL